MLDMRSLRVEGNVHLSANQVARLSGLTSTTNVLWMSPGPIEQLLESDPWVQKATLVRHLPSTITITITERVPAAVTAGTSAMLVAGDGTVLGRAAPATELPLIVPPPGTITVGERLPMSASLSIVAVLPESIRARVTTVTSGADGSLALLMRDGMTVYYGDASRVSEKADALRAVLAWAARQGVHPAYVDVRAPTAPAIGTAPPASPAPGA
jgi:cell division protein FtsQ